MSRCSASPYPSGDGWRDEEVSNTLRLLEIAKRTDVPVYAGAVWPLVQTPAVVKRWESLYGKLFYNGAWTEKWPEEGAVRRSPYHADPYFVPPAAAGDPENQGRTGNGRRLPVAGKCTSFRGRSRSSRRAP